MFFTFGLTNAETQVDYKIKSQAYAILYDETNTATVYAIFDIFNMDLDNNVQDELQF
jgi:hypothetical protein